jgi:hypothetical protein
VNQGKTVADENQTKNSDYQMPLLARDLSLPGQFTFRIWRRRGTIGNQSTP